MSDSLTAGEALTAGDFVNVYNDAGTVKMRKANASNARRADGYVKANVSSGAAGTIYYDDSNDVLSGLTGASIYYLSTTAGGATTTAPTSSGQLVQELGKAISTTKIVFVPGPVIQIA